MSLDDLLQELGPMIGLGPLTLEADGVCAIGFADGAEILISRDAATPDGCVLIGTCGDVPASQRVSYLRLLLEANFFHRDTGDAVLAIDPDLDETLLIWRLPIANLGADGLAQALNVFSSYQQRWLQRSAKALAVA